MQIRVNSWKSWLDYGLAIVLFSLSVFWFTPIAEQKASPMIVIAWALVEIALCSFLLFLYYRQQPKPQFSTINLWFIVRQYVVLIVILFILSMIHTHLTNETNTTNNTNITSMIQQSSWLAIMTGLQTSLFAPITEELLFRGLLLSNFNKKTQKPLYLTIIVGSSLLFGLLHANTSFSGNMIYIGMALVLCWTYAKHENIYENIGVHMLNNIISLVAMSLGL